MKLLSKKVAIITFLLTMLSAPPLFAEGQVKINISKQNISLKEALNDIEIQSKKTLAYNATELDVSREMSLNLSNENLDESLTEILQGTDFTYEIGANDITIVSKTKQSEKKKISGQILDDKGQALIGVSVMIKGSSVGTVTDTNGRYTIEAQDGDQLVISYVGYDKKEVTAYSSKPMSIVMASSDNELNAVVVTALGIKRSEKALSYNVGKIKSEELTSVKDANFVNSLNGKVAGLNVVSSGSVGGATKVVMRGVKSISGSNNALYVIDGIPLLNSNGGDTSSGGVKYATAPAGEGISDLNPEDIESISVLTGPAAAALYGSSAANGAILVTTKKGKAGKPQVTISHSTDFSSPLVMPRFQNTYGNDPGEFSSWGAKLSTPTSYNPADFFQTGYTSTTSASVSVGTERNQTFVSIGATNAAGIVPNNKYDRYNFSARNTTKMYNDRLTLDLGAQYIVQNDQNLMSQGLYFNPLVSTYLFPRGENFDNVRMYERYDEGRNIMTQWWPYGDQGLSLQNPYWTANRNLLTHSRNRYMLNIGLTYKVLDWLSLSGRVRVDNTDTDWEKKLYASTAGSLAASKGYYATTKAIDQQTYSDFMANINKSFGDVSLTANVGTSYFYTRGDRSGYQGQLSKLPNFFSGNNIDLNAVNSGIIEGPLAPNHQVQSVFASTELGYKSMLYLTLTGRNDWDSALANTEKNNFFYPSVGLSALISQMTKLPTWISYMKVRGSYSSVGSAPQPYYTIPTYTYNSDGSINTVTKLTPKDYKPERTNSFEGGLDLRFLKNKLSVSGTVYKSNTYNQVFIPEASASSAYSSLITQSGNVSNWGIEASLGYNNNFNKLHWDSQLTFSMNRNKIKEMTSSYDANGVLTVNDKMEFGSDQATGNYREILTEGGSIGDIYLTQSLRTDNQGNIWVDPNTGALGIVNDPQKVGNYNPRCNLGFRNTFSYAGINLSFMFAARIGGQVVSQTQAMLDQYGVSEASAMARDNGGVPVNGGLYDPQTYYSSTAGSGLLTNYVYSATNIRLQELTLGYTLPKKWIGVDTTISFVGRNLWMIYNKAPFDPQSIATTGNNFLGLDYFMQPSTRNLGFSLRLKF